MFWHPKNLENIWSHAPRSDASWANILTEIFNRSTAKIRSEIRALRKSIRDKCLGLKKGRACPDYEIPSAEWKETRPERTTKARNHYREFDDTIAEGTIIRGSRFARDGSTNHWISRRGAAVLSEYLYARDRGGGEGKHGLAYMHTYEHTGRVIRRDEDTRGLSCDDWLWCLRSFTRAPYRPGSLHRHT